MKRKNLIATVAILATSGTTCGDWSLSLVHVSDNPVTGSGLSFGFGPSTTWEVWAHFDDAMDVLGVLGKEGQTMFLTVVSGSVFNQVSGYGVHQNFPPLIAQKTSDPVGWALDTFVTIGAQFSPSPGQHPNLAFTPGFFDIINNFEGSWNTANLPDQEGGWITVDMPDFAHGTDIVLMQLTVSEGALFELVFGLDTLQHGYLYDWDGISFAEHGQIGSGASYLTNIPAPGTGIIALLAFATPRVRRRRRL